MGKVLSFTGTTTNPIDPDEVLKAQLGGCLAEVLVIGEEKDGNLVFASSTSDLAECNMYLDRVKALIIDMIESDQAMPEPPGTQG